MPALKLNQAQLHHVFLEFRTLDRDKTTGETRDREIACVSMDPSMLALLPREGEVIELPVEVDALPTLGVRASSCIDPAILRNDQSQARWWRVRQVVKFYDWTEQTLHYRVLCEHSSDRAI